MPYLPGKKMFVTRLFGKEYRIKIIRTPPNKIFMFLTPLVENAKIQKINSKTYIRKVWKNKRGRRQKVNTLGLN